MSRVMAVSRQVGWMLCSEGIPELTLRLDDASPTTLRGSNLCESDWPFKIQGYAILEMQYAQLRELSTSATDMLENRDACAGQGCRGGGWVGQVRRRVTGNELATRAPLHLEAPEGGRRRSLVRSRFKLASFDSLLEQELRYRPAFSFAKGHDFRAIDCTNCGLDRLSISHEATPVANPPIVTTGQSEAGMLPNGSPTSDSGQQIPRSARISGGAIVQTHKPGVSKVQQAANGLGGPPSMESYRHAMKKREEAKILRLITAARPDRADDARGAGLRSGGGFGFCWDACSVARKIASGPLAEMAQPALRIKHGLSAKISTSWRVCDSTNSSVEHADGRCCRSRSPFIRSWARRTSVW
jgi:hypothetical protein